MLYEIGYLDPALIADYAKDFIGLLHDRNNRIVWGAMIALATVASLRPSMIWEQIDDVMSAVQNGSVITVVWGVRALAQVAAHDPGYRGKILPLLFSILKTCIPRDAPVHAESMLCCINSDNHEAFKSILLARQGEMSAAQQARLKKVIKKLDAKN